MSVQQPASLPSEPPGPADAYFTRVSERAYRPTRHTGGAWSQSEQHISPLCGLVVHAVEQDVVRREPGSRTDPGGGQKVISRIGFDILGPITMDDFDIDVGVIRPGRSIELVEAVVTCGAREVLRARVWRLARFDTAHVAGGQPAPIPAPDELPAWPMATVWQGGYIATLDARRTLDSGPGRATAWVSTALALLAGEDASPLARFVSLVDTANGVGARQPTDEWLFPNVDLTIHLHRQPVAGSVGLDTTVVFGADGHGVTSSVLHDEQGPVGLAAQILTVRPQAVPRHVERPEMPA